MKAMPELYYFHDATCGLKARFTMLEKGVRFIPRRLDRYRLAEPEYLAINPLAVVPTLVHDGLVIDESTIIALYIDDAFDGPPLRPDAASDRAEMYRWLKRIDEHYFDAIAAVTFGLAYRNKVLVEFQTAEKLTNYLDNIKVSKKRALRERLIQDGASGPDVRAGIDTLQTMLEQLQVALASQRFVAGPIYSLADACLTPFLMRLDYLGLDELWSKQPSIKRWWGEIQGRPSFKAILTESFPDEYREKMQALVKERPAEWFAR